MKIATDIEQGHDLKNILGENTADMYWEKHWAYNGGLKVRDSRYGHPRDEGVDHIPAWSLSKLLSLVPDNVAFMNEERAAADGITEDNKEYVFYAEQYDFHLFGGIFEGIYLGGAKYAHSEGQVFFTEGKDPIDILVNTIKWLGSIEYFKSK